MRYIVCLLIDIAIAIAYASEWYVAVSVLFFALMVEVTVLNEMKAHDNMKFWKDHPNL